MNNEQLIEQFKSLFLSELEIWNPTVDNSEILCDEPDLGVGITCSVYAFGNRVETYFSVTYLDGSMCAEVGDNGDALVINKELLLEYILSTALQDGVKAA